MAYWLRALVSLLEDLIPVPSFHIRQLRLVCNSSSGRSNAFGLLRPDTHMHIYM